MNDDCKPTINVTYTGKGHVCVKNVTSGIYLL